MKIKADFAILDITTGRKQLDKLIEKNGKTGASRHEFPERIPVIIRGWLTHRHGEDDGTSQEFGVEVESVEIPEK